MAPLHHDGLDDLLFCKGLQMLSEVL